MAKPSASRSPRPRGVRGLHQVTHRGSLLPTDEMDRATALCGSPLRQTRARRELEPSVSRPKR
jgi:hypothetical protein